MRKKRNTAVTSITEVTSVRLASDTLKILRTQLPKEVSVSALCRALIQAYLEGSIPQANRIILLEVARAMKDKERYQFKPRENESDGRSNNTAVRVSA